MASTMHSHSVATTVPVNDSQPAKRKKVVTKVKKKKKTTTTLPTNSIPKELNPISQEKQRHPNTTIRTYLPIVASSADDLASTTAVAGSRFRRRKNDSRRPLNGAFGIVGYFTGKDDDDVNVEEDDSYSDLSNDDLDDSSQSENDSDNDINKHDQHEFHKQDLEQSAIKHDVDLGKALIAATCSNANDKNLRSSQGKAVASEINVSKEPGDGMGSNAMPRIQVKRLPSDTSCTENEKTVNGSKNLKSPLNVVEAIIKCINILLPLLFAVLAILHIIKVDRPEFDLFAQRVMQANTIAITVWPIVFAAIAAQSLKAYATFQAERGIRLMNLEQLLHSSSFSSSIKQPLLLRKLDWMSVLLFLLWGLSPLASQALQRLSSTTPGSVVVQQNISYVTPDFTAVQYDGFIADANPADLNAWYALFSSALLTSPNIAHSAQDLWGSPKIPSIASLSQTDSDGWSLVPENDDDDTVYSSLLGCLVAGINPTDLTEFTIPWVYESFNCTTPSLGRPQKFNQSSQLHYVDPTGNFWLGMTTDEEEDAGEGTLHWAFLHDTGSSPVSPFGDTNLSLLTNTSSFLFSTCTIETVSVLAHITCQTKELNTSSCHVDKMQSVPLNSSSFSGPIPPDVGWFVPLLAFSLNNGQTTGTSLQEQYIANPDDVLNYRQSNTSEMIGNLSAIEFSEHVTTLFNTFTESSSNTDEHLRGLSKSTGNFTGGTSTNTDPVWAINPAWIAVFFFCDAILLLFAIADIIWEVKTIGPDFLGFASSIVRSNQHLRKEFQGRKLSGHEKARAMADLQVMIQDVNTAGEKGKIALAPKSAGAVRLTRNRDYQ